MSDFHGKSGSITSAATATARVTEWGYTETAELADRTAMGDTEKSYVAGIVDGVLTLQVVYDPDDTAQDDWRAGQTIAAILYPETTTIGDFAWTGSVVVESFEVTGSMGDMVRASITAKGVLAEAVIV